MNSGAAKPHVRTFAFGEIEPRWQNEWELAAIFHSNPSPDRPNWVVVELPPFANGNLHLGHVRNYAIGDASARFRRMAGFNVLYTSGFDSFGLPNELAAIEAKCHPQELAERVIVEMRHDFIRLGLSHDRRRVMGYHDESFYRWVQWVFLRLLEHGFAYRKNIPVLWCGHCGLTLADSLVEFGACWRCHNPVETRTMEQWMIRESEFAEELLAGLDRLPGWPQKIKRIHRDWIGRRNGATLRFQVASSNLILEAFLYEPALAPGIALIAISPEHPLLAELSQAGLIDTESAARIAALRQSGNAGDYARRLGSISNAEIMALGISASHPLFPGPIPLMVFSGLDLRTNDGVLVACPSHVRTDARLVDAAGLTYHQVLWPASGIEDYDPFAWDDEWVYRHGELAGRSVSEGRAWVLQELFATGAGARAVKYRLRDWSVARQRYWGPPVPVIHCPRCGLLGVPDSDLPVKLPVQIDLDVANPLAACEDFVHTACPQCGGAARRDTDTLEAYSSPWWYHWMCKGVDTWNPFDVEECRLYMPVDLMIGGEDQARSCFFHARMMARALKRVGVVEDDEPIAGLLAIGMVKTGGRKMSKSEGNAVDPRGLIETYGADSLRFAMLGAAAPDNDVNWSDDMVGHAHSFLASIWSFFAEHEWEIRFEELTPATEIDTAYSLSRKLARQVETAVDRTSSAMQGNLFHLAAQNLKMLFERIELYLEEAVKRRKTLDSRDRAALAVASSVFLRMLAPLCPHLAEEIWAVRGGQGLIATLPWPASIPRVQDTIR